MKRVLLITHCDQIAGAEKVVRAVLDGANENQLILDLAVLKKLPHGQLGAGRQVFGFKKIFFGRYDLLHSHLFLPGLLVRLRRLIDNRFFWVHTVHYTDYGSQSGGWLKKWLDYKFIFEEAMGALVFVQA